MISILYLSVSYSYAIRLPIRLRSHPLSTLSRLRPLEPLPLAGPRQQPCRSASVCAARSPRAAPRSRCCTRPAVAAAVVVVDEEEEVDLLELMSHHQPKGPRSGGPGY